MLSVRLADPFQAVYTLDKALLDVLTDREIREYRIHRDFSAIRNKLAENGAQPTVFTFDPLKVEHEHFVDQIAAGLESQAAWSIFRHHLRKIDNFPNSLRRDKDDAVDDSCRQYFPRDVVNEMALLITEKANGDTRGFTVGHTFAEQLVRARSALRLVSVADSESASEVMTVTHSASGHAPVPGMKYDGPSTA